MKKIIIALMFSASIVCADPYNQYPTFVSNMPQYGGFVMKSIGATYGGIYNVKNNNVNSWCLGYGNNIDLSGSTCMLRWSTSTVTMAGGITISGTITGNVTGNLTGNVTGDLTGSVTGASSLNLLKAGDTATGAMVFSNPSFSVGTSTFVVKLGNVGIGTTNPLAPLDITSNISVDYASYIKNSNAGGYGLQIRGGSTANNSGLDVYNYNASAILFKVIGDGTVAIGTSTPNGTLGMVSTFPRFSFTDNDEAGGTYSWEINSGRHVGGELNFTTFDQAGFANPSTKMTILKSGNVGIGTTAPSSVLHVGGTGKTTLGIDTLANILAYDPTIAGEMLYCSNCATSTLCISTGTAVSQVADIGDRTTPCK